MARILEAEIRKIPEIVLTQKVEANGVFAIVPGKIIAALKEKYFFYMWNEHISEVRWMTSFDTTEEEIIGFTNLIKQLLS